MTLNTKNKPYVYVVGFAAALAGLLSGLDAGIIAGALPFIRSYFHLSNSASEQLVVALLTGAIVGTLICGYISRLLGRHFAIWISALIFCVGAVLCALSVNLGMLIVMRFLVGLAIGLSSFSAPLYLAEIAPKNVRGGLVTLYQFMITLGILVSYLTDTAFTPSGDWRWMFGVTFFPAFIMLLAVLFLPKSPRWLILRNRKEEARAVLGRVSNSPEEISTEISEIEATLQKTHSIRDVFRGSGFIKVLLIGVALQAIQQFSGINAVIYYMPSIFSMAGFASPLQQMWATVIVGAVNTLTTVIAIFYVDRWGRKPMLYFTLAVITISLLLLGYLFHLGIHTQLTQYLAVALVVIYIFGFAISLGSVPWVVCAEIFPLQGRDIGLTVTTAANWGTDAIVSGTFLTMVASIGSSLSFGVFGVCCIIGFIIVNRFVPETKGVSLEHIEQNLVAGKRCRDLGE